MPSRGSQTEAQRSPAHGRGFQVLGDGTSKAGGRSLTPGHSPYQIPGDRGGILDDIRGGDPAVCGETPIGYGYNTPVSPEAGDGLLRCNSTDQIEGKTLGGGMVSEELNHQVTKPGGNILPVKEQGASGTHGIDTLATNLDWDIKAHIRAPLTKADI